MNGRELRVVLAAAMVFVAAACSTSGNHDDIDLPEALESVDVATREVSELEIVELDSREREEATVAETVDEDRWDGGGQAAPWGEVTGACGEMAGLLASPEPAFVSSSFVVNSLNDFDQELLCDGAEKVYESPNAGGSSICSETMSVQFLHDCDGGVLYKTETEVEYDTQGSITDYVIVIAGEKVGVSVTRAYKGPFVDTFTVADAGELLTKKLGGINESSANVSDGDKWGKQILHIWTLQSAWVATLEDSYQDLPDETKSDTIVLVTVEEGSEWVVKDECK